MMMETLAEVPASGKVPVKTWTRYWRCVSEGLMQISPLFSTVLYDSEPTAALTASTMSR